MTKVIVLSTVLGLSALGMACGEAPANNAANKPAANTTNVAPVSTPATVTTPANTMAPNSNAPAANASNSAMKPATNTMAPNSNMKPAANAAPSPAATKKP